MAFSEAASAAGLFVQREQERRLSRCQLAELQLSRLNELLADVSTRPFYRERLKHVVLPLGSLSELSTIPFLVKADLEPIRNADEPTLSPLFGSVFDLPRERYVRFHQTSGTKGWPLPVLDTKDDWAWWLECWQFVLDAAEVTDRDVAMMAFSFGPFIGFWTAHDALVDRGAMVIPGGGMSSEARLKLILSAECTVLCCTPTYALHLANVADELGMDLASDSAVRRIIVAGEPGGSIAAVRERIETAWGARVVDHSGASEVGAWGFGASVAGDVTGEVTDLAASLGLHVIETQFIAECLVFDQAGQARPAVDGELSELVLTSLGRRGGPAIRYRTGDIVRGVREHDRACRFLWLDGGVLGRADDMLVIRGVNVFPSSIESIVREVDSKAEFRMIATRKDEMDQLELEIEANYEVVAKLEVTLRDRLAMRVNVRGVEVGSLPRFEAKSRRWVDLRNRA